LQCPASLIYVCTVLFDKYGFGGYQVRLGLAAIIVACSLQATAVKSFIPSNHGWLDMELIAFFASVPFCAILSPKICLQDEGDASLILDAAAPATVPRLVRNIKATLL
jgi:hypothetical protein